MVEIRIGDEKKDAKDTVVITPKKDEPKVEKQTIIIREPAKRRVRKRPAPKKPRPVQVIVKSPQAKAVKKKPVKKTTIVKKVTTTVNKKVTDDMIRVLRANQNLVDEMVKLNTQVMDNVIRLSTSVTVLTDKMNDFLAKERREELPSDVVIADNVEDKIKRLEEKLNSIIVALSEKR